MVLRFGREVLLRVSTMHKKAVRMYDGVLEVLVLCCGVTASIGFLLWNALKMHTASINVRFV